MQLAAAQPHQGWAPQGMSQPPQWAGSVFVSTQVPPQSVSGGVQATPPVPVSEPAVPVLVPVSEPDAAVVLPEPVLEEEDEAVALEVDPVDPAVAVPEAPVDEPPMDPEEDAPPPLHPSPKERARLVAKWRV